MTEHICPIHDVPFKRYTKGDQEWYSHKTDDGEWCKEYKLPKQATPEPSPQPTESKSTSFSTNSSIEAQVAVKEIGECWRAGKLEDGSMEVQTYRNWIMSKLSNWSSQGKTSDIPKPEPPTKEQRIRLSKALKNWDVKEAQELLRDKFLTNDTKQLSKEQMEYYLEYLSKLPEKIEPEDVPF